MSIYRRNNNRRTLRGPRGPRGERGPAGPAGGGGGGSAAWNDITGKPSTFPPSSHTHPISDVTNLQTSLDGKAATSHTHSIANVTGLQTALDGKAASTHSHAIADVTGLQTALDGKQAAGSYAAASHTHTRSQITDFAHTHLIDDVTGLQTALDARSVTGHTHAISDVTNLQTTLDGKANVLSRDTALIIETDFYNTGTPFAQGLVGSAVSSGTVTAISAVPAHPGIVALRDSTTANGGYRIQTDVTAIRIAGGEKFVCVFQVRGVRAGMTCYMGFFDSTTNAAPTDALCFVITANGTAASMVARGRANNTASDSSTFSLSTNTWYTAIITVNSGATSCNFALYAESGSLIQQADITNIPTAAGRETGMGVAAYESSTDAAADLLHLDYLRFEINRTLVR